MPVKALVDTGALVALVDPRERWHEPCARTFVELPLPLGTSAAVLTEFFHLVGDARHLKAACWRLLRSGAIMVLPLDDSDMASIEELMLRYADRPMDFADATLVHLARRESLATIFTIDFNDFETYRIEGRRRFRIVPERS